MKSKYLKSWAKNIQERIWERDVFIALKKSKNENDKDLDALKMNNDKDQELVDYIGKYISESCE